MSFRVQATDACRSSIDGQLNWYREDENRGGAALAERWFDALHAALLKLGTQPAAYGFAPENGEWFPELEIRQMLFRPWKSGVGWRVLFAIDEKAKLVTVLQVRHEHRRWLHEREQGGS